MKPLCVILRQVGRDGWLVLGCLAIGAVIGGAVMGLVLFETLCRLP